MKKINILLLIVLLFSCSPATRISVTNVNDVSHINGSASLYALPMTVFAITVTVRQESFIPGPYHKYAKKYLGIADAVSMPFETWTLKDASLTGYAEADPDFLFQVDGMKRASCSQVMRELLDDSLAMLPGDFVSRQVFTNRYDPPQDPMNFTDLSIKRNFEADKGILISEVLPDSAYVTAHDARAKHSPDPKSLEQKAEEAANFIIKIRKRRFKLISGQYEFMPDGEALGRAVDELNHAEEEYLTLFTGKKSNSFHTRTFHYVPESIPETGRTILFRFSGKEGFLEAAENDGKPVMVVIQDMNKIKGFDALALNHDGLNGRLVYRIPDQAIIQIYFGEQLLLETKQPVYQFGNLMTTEPSGKTQK